MELVVKDKVYITAATNAAKSFTYGQTISKEWLMAQFAMKEPATGTKKDFEAFAFEFLGNMDGFKEILLLEYQMHLKSIRGEGYLIVLPQDQTAHAMASMRNAVRSEIRKAVTILSNVNADLLTDEQRRHKDDSLGKIAALSAFTKSNRLE